MSFPHPKWTFSNRPRPFLPIDLVHKKFPLSSLPFISARITTCTNRHICLLPSRKYTLIYRLSKRASSFRVSSPYQCPVQFYPIHPPYLFPTLFSPTFFFTSSFPRFTSSFFFSTTSSATFFFRHRRHCLATRPLHIDFPPQTEEGRDGRRRLPVSRVKADVT